MKAVVLLLLGVLCIGTAADAAEQNGGALATFDGHAHWYGGQFHGRRTASGAIFDKHLLTAAHPSLPFGTRVKVSSCYSHKSAVVVVNDRCPKLSQRCIDLSEGAAREIGIYPYAPSLVHCEILGKQQSVKVAAAKSGPAH